MNIFVLCTGRCGSNTFISACQHITNFSAGHETRSHITGPARVEYPDNHIEADNRLTWFAGRLERRYQNRALYVHLTRSREETARAFERNWMWQGSISRAWRNAILKGGPPSRSEACLDYVDAVTENISVFLKDKDWMPFRLETAKADFEVFWDRIGARGDLEAALSEWEMKRNATPSALQRLPTLAGHIAQRALRFHR